jgi:phthalate 4,5-dioxygenase
MLSKEENALVTQVGPGTPMGELFRRFWLPVLLSGELLERDGPPIRTRILGEDLVVFRDSLGQVGLIDAHCPHRGAGLFFGRNEEAGLRCVYHGWKFDVTGACVDMPSEPVESNFKHKVKATAYPTREWGGLIWVYMGPSERIPELPQLEWARVPAEQRTVNRVLVESSWLQMLEGDIDTSHSMFLHSAMDPALKQTSRRLDLTNDRSPRLSVQQTDYGLAYGGRYDTVDGRFDWRVTQWLMPCYTLIANKSWPVLGRAAVPIDDEHTSVISVRYDAEGGARLTPDQGWSRTKYQLPDGAVIDVARQEANQSNDYLIDRDFQRTRNYTGITRIFDQDRAVTESMGPIVDRSKEHLGTSDLAIIGMRRRLLSMLQDLQQGIEPQAPFDGELYHVRSCDALSDEGEFTRFLEVHQETLQAVV